MDTPKYNGFWGTKSAASQLYSPPSIPGHKTFTIGKMSNNLQDPINIGPFLHQTPAYGSRPPVTPPISPETPLLKQSQPLQEHSSNVDPPLYSPDTEAAVSPTAPLFDTLSTDEKGLIERYAARPFINQPPYPSPPRWEDYMLTSRVWKMYNRDPHDYQRRVNEDLSQYSFGKTFFGPENKPHSLLRAVRKSGPRPQGRSKVIGNTPKPKRDRPLSAKARASSVESKSSMAPRGSIHFEAVNPFKHPKPMKATKAVRSAKPAKPAKPANSAKVAKVSRSAQDNFQDFPDYCPPLSTLEGKKLKVVWQSERLDLSNDPHRHLLHADEIDVASVIRMTCAQYLLNKRRLFIGRIRCMQLPKEKEFRKTDAQNACCVDVNKASKLHTAFENVGWLDRKYFEQYVHLDMPVLSKGT